MLNYKRFILEKITSTNLIYHFTSLENLENILNDNALKMFSYNSNERCVSLTRSFNIPETLDHENYLVRLVLNRDKLSYKYKLVPYLYQPKDGGDFTWGFKGEREERIYKDIENLDDYLIRIDVLENDIENEEELKLYKKIQAENPLQFFNSIISFKNKPEYEEL